MPTHEDFVRAFRKARPDIEEICRYSGTPGLSLGVIRHGETIFLDNIGHRSIEEKLPTTSDTIYHIASMTKSFTGVAFGMLVADGKVEWDTPVREIVPEFKSIDDMVTKWMTVSDLLGHRTGLQRGDSLWLGAEGELMFPKSDTLAFVNSLKPIKSLTSSWMYNNFGYAMVGLIIERLSGESYPDFIRKKILEPLGMSRTITDKSHGLPDDVAKAYSALSDATPHQIPPPDQHAGTSIGSAGGLMSTVNDLIKYYSTIMKICKPQLDSPEDAHDNGILGDLAQALTALATMEKPSLREKTYGAGWARIQLPGKVGDIGVNPGLLSEMPTLARGVNSKLAVWHQGSLVGFTSFVMLFPELESGVMVLTNSMALNDAADWIGQLMVEILLQSPRQNDYVGLARQSAKQAIENYEEMVKTLEKGQEHGTDPKRLQDYVGSYYNNARTFSIHIALDGQNLEILFQGRESQKYTLKHYHRDTFSWLLSYDDQIKRVRFIVMNPDYYLVRFRATEADGIDLLN